VDKITESQDWIEGLIKEYSPRANDNMGLEIASLRKTFGHIHVAKEGSPQDDSCKACGLDLRDPIHYRC